MLKLNYTYLEIQTGHTKWPTMDKYIFYSIFYTSKHALPFPITRVFYSLPIPNLNTSHSVLSK